MENKSLHSGVIVALHTLGYEDSDVLPKLDDVRKSYFNKARQLHPDKNSKADNMTREKKEEAFKKLLNAYKLVTEFIIENDINEENSESDEEYDSDTEDQGDEEICFTAEEYKDVNMFTTNSHSVSIKIPTKHADAWEQVLDEYLGNKIDRTSGHNGVQFKSQKGVSITLWKKKEDTSTILVDGKIAYLEFAEKDMRKLYLEVKLKVEKNKDLQTRKNIERKSKNSKFLKERPRYKILKSHSNSLKMTVKRAVQEQLDKSVSKLLNDNISLVNDTITLEEDDESEPVEASEDKSVSVHNYAGAKSSKLIHTVEDKVTLSKDEFEESTKVRVQEEKTKTDSKPLKKKMNP